MRESGPRKRDEDGDDDGDVDEDDHHDDDSPPDGTRCHRERGGEALPLVLPPPWLSPFGPWPS